MTRPHNTWSSYATLVLNDRAPLPVGATQSDERRSDVGPEVSITKNDDGGAIPPDNPPQAF